MSQESPHRSTFNILFVCTGNTCRSPTAEAIARRELDRRGWSHARVASAGIAAEHGASASPPARAVAQRRGVDLSAHRSQPLSPELLEWADLVLCMSPSHLFPVEQLGGGDKGTLLGDFVATGGAPGGGAVTDPYGGHQEVYEETYDELERLIRSALDRLAPILQP